MQQVEHYWSLLFNVFFVEMQLLEKEKFEKLFWHPYQYTSLPNDLDTSLAGRKIHVVSMYFLRCNSTGPKIYVLWTYFIDVISMGKKSTFFPRTFFDLISMVKKSTLFPRFFFEIILKIRRCFWLNWKLIKTF